MLIFNLGLCLLLAVFWLWIFYRRKGQEAEERLLSGQERFLDELAGQYVKRGDIQEALEESIQLCDSRMQQELMQMLDMLKTETDPLDDGYPGGYMGNACFLLLFTLCDTIRSFGDLQVRGVSLFVNNIRYIKEEVRTELLRRQEGRYAFLGLTALCLLPFFFSVPIWLWSASISGDLNRFYTGTYGFVTLVLCFFLTVFCALGVQELQYPTMPEGRKHTIAMRLLQIPILAKLIDMHIAAHYSRYLRKNELLKELQGFGNIREFFIQKLICACGSALFAGAVMAGSFAVGTGGFAAGAGSEAGIARRGILLFLIILACAVTGYFLPDAWVVILQVRVGQQKSEETLRFETLILIVRHFEMITVEEILRWMERFSSVFSRALQRAVDDFSCHRRESLEQLKEDLAYEPAVKLVDTLIVCDEIPVAQAFYDLEGERAYHMEQFWQKAESLQREKAAFARVIAFLPFVALLALRLVVPFVLEGLTQLNSY